MSHVSSPSSAAPPAGAPSTAELALRLHQLVAGHPGSAALFVEHRPGERVALGSWPIPAWAGHPIDVLLGYRAPSTWDAVGLSCVGQAHRLDHELPEGAATFRRSGTVASRPVRTTFLRDRSGGGAGVVQAEGEPPEVIPGLAAGWGPDALSRALDQPTPAPPGSVAGWVETAWLDTLAAALLAGDTTSLTWHQLAATHPLVDPDHPLPPDAVAALSLAFTTGTTWTRVRRAWAADQDHLERRLPHPPGGRIVPLATWFDDGSFARWVLRRHAPAADALDALLAVLPERLHRPLTSSLVTVAPTDPASASPGPPPAGGPTHGAAPADRPHVMDGPCWCGCLDDDDGLDDDDLDEDDDEWPEPADRWWSELDDDPAATHDLIGCDRCDEPGGGDG